MGLPGFELLCSYLEQMPGGGGVGWPRGGGSVFIYFGFFFSACVIITAAVIEAPMVPHVSRGVPPLLCLIPPPPSYVTGCNGSLGRSRLLLKVTAGETGVRIQIQVCLTYGLGGAQVSLGQAYEMVQRGWLPGAQSGLPLPRKDL